MCEKAEDAEECIKAFKSLQPQWNLIMNKAQTKIVVSKAALVNRIDPNSTAAPTIAGVGLVTQHRYLGYQFNLNLNEFKDLYIKLVDKYVNQTCTLFRHIELGMRKMIFYDYMGSIDRLALAPLYAT